MADSARMSRKRLTGATVAVLSLVVYGLVGSVPHTGAAAPRPALEPAITAAPTGTGTAARGRSVTGRKFTKAPTPTAAQREFLEETEENEPDGPHGRVATRVDPRPLGPSTSRYAAAAPTDLVFYRGQFLPAGGSRSAVDEPSAVQAGLNLFATGNWYAAYSHNSGAGYTYLDPFSLFGSGFCCDQLIAYDLGHDRYFWLAQYNDHLMLANSAGSDLANWCFWNWYPSSFGLPAGASLDFNKLALSTTYVYVASNVYGAGGGSLVARFPIEPQSTCSSFSFNYLYRTTEFSPAFVQNAGDTMYWGTNWTGDLTLGSTFRILRWDDAEPTAVAYDRTIDPFTFMFNGTGNCASADGVVVNWCQRTDSRMTGTGYLAEPAKGGAEAVLGWAFNAQQDAGHPFPYIRRVYFRATDLAYAGAADFWATWAAHLYPTLAPDNRGHVGMAFAWGGGTGTSHYYPGSGVVVDDDVSPNAQWAYNFYQTGAGNPCLNGDGLRRWGDYLDIHPIYPAGYGWVATGYALGANAGSCGTTATVNVGNVAFGRARDSTAYSRWR